MRKLIHQRLRTIGLPPGALVRVQEAGSGIQTRIAVTKFGDEQLEEFEVGHLEELPPHLEGKGPTWVDISGDYPVSLLDDLGKLFGIHPLTLEDIQHRDQRPKVEEFEGYMFIVVQKPVYLKDAETVQMEQVSMLLSRHQVISIREYTPGPYSAIRARMRQERRRIAKLGTDYLAYVIVDSVVDEFFVAMEHMEERTESLERDLYSSRSGMLLDHLHQLMREQVILRKAVWPLREVISSLSKTESPLFDEGIKLYLKDLQDHIVQVIELTEISRDRLSQMLDIYLSTMSHYTNQVMKTLTIIASIFIPLTLITGIFGMNFKYMPGLEWRWGYPLALLLMAGVATVMLAYFRRKRWF
ncbi:MAG: magnesium/cobalt transporter CorA [Parachlamydiales bacterium]